MGVVVTLVVVMMVVAVVGPVAAQTQGSQQGRFQLHSSCGSEIRLLYLVVNDPMWLRTEDEELTLLTSTTNETCNLPPRATFRVTAQTSLEVKMVGTSGKGEGKEEAPALCSFPKQDVSLTKGLLKVSCLKERGEAEAEMLGALDSPDDPATTKDSAATTLDASITSPASSATTPATTATTPASTATPPISRAQLPAGRDLDLTFTLDATQPTASTAGPPDTRERLAAQPTPRSTASTEGATSSLGTTTAVTEPATSSSTRPPVTDGALTVPTPGGSVTQEAGHAGTPTPPSGKHKSLIKKESIAAAEPVSLTNASQTDGEKSGMDDDQVLYLAGAGAGVLALVLGVAVVVGVAHHRRRQAIAAARKEELFISGGYRGSMNSLAPTGKGGGGGSGGSGAYLNANVMYYSGADPEVAEAFELEERVLTSSGISYSTHDIPKCLKE